MAAGDAAQLLAEADAAFRRDEWPEAVARYREAAGLGDLSGHHWYALGDAAWWIGEIDRALDAWERAHDRFVAAGDLAGAAMAAMFLACHSLERGDAAAGSGWVNRTKRILEDVPDGPAHGYPLYFQLFGEMSVGDLDAAERTADRLGDIGRRFDDPSLVALSTLGTGRILVERGRTDEGMSALDDAMLAALSGRLHPVWTGAIYCHLMDVCHRLQDLQRAGEWTRAAAHWCETIPDGALYRGICRVHRAQVLHAQGAWREAEREAVEACNNAARLHVGTTAEAHYEIGEIRRRRGDMQGAETAFRRANELGRDPQPGFALLRLDEGRPNKAAASIQAALETERDPLPRAKLCAAQVAIATAGGDLEAASAACDELEAIAGTYRSSGLDAAARHARGTVELHAGEPGQAITTLRAACRRWQELDAPHLAADVRLLLAQGYRMLDDDDAAELELDAADGVFRRLGAEPGRRRVAELRGRSEPPGGLTTREVEVLRFVATGATNHEIASMLFISERTVHRHMSNIFAKLGVTSRSAATAFAFEHDVVGGNA